MKNGQTEPEGGTRSCTWVQREVKFVRNKKDIKRKELPIVAILLH